MILIRKFITSNRLRCESYTYYKRLYLYNIKFTARRRDYPFFSLSKENKCFIKIIESSHDLYANIDFVSFDFQSTSFINVSITNEFNNKSFFINEKCGSFIRKYHTYEERSFLNDYTKYYKNKVK